MISFRCSFSNRVRSRSLPVTISRFLSERLMFCSTLNRLAKVSLPTFSFSFARQAAISGFSPAIRSSRGINSVEVSLGFSTNCASSSRRPLRARTTFSLTACMEIGSRADILHYLLNITNDKCSHTISDKRRKHVPVREEETGKKQSTVCRSDNRHTCNAHLQAQAS